MKDEFNLSEKSQEIQGATMFGITDVKEFIRRLKEVLESYRSIVGFPDIYAFKLQQEIDKLAGEELTK